MSNPTAHVEEGQVSTNFPIRQLPREILSEVFVECLPDTTEAHWMSTHSAPLLLCGVCSSWRALALATPQLWSRVGIYINDSTVDASIGVGVTRDWLNRSGSLPLMLRLRHKPCFSFATSRPALVEDILSTFCIHASRWQDVTLDLEGCPPIIFPRLGTLPLLRAFRLEASQHLVIGLPFSASPRLTRLSWPFPFSAPINPQIPWSQMTHLHIAMGTTLFAALETIRLCPLLQEFEVDMRRAPVIRALPRGPIVENRHLRKLDIVVHEDCGLLFDSLTLPALTELTLDTDSDYAYRGRLFPVPSVHKSLLNLLTRSNCELDKLGLIDCGFSASAFLECLEHPSLRTLSLLKVENVYNQPMLTDDVLLRLTDLPSPPSPPVLLPKLAHLILEMCLAASPEMLGRMVYSRRCACDEDEDDEGQLKVFSLVARKLNERDEVYIDKAFANGLDAAITYDEYATGEDDAAVP
ncbi:hypothetical protein APHAL10511_008538 [Amanita phalloides]|nr:hypothetical protein APHAL10511_008538 [Amanita phalloides]